MARLEDVCIINPKLDQYLTDDAEVSFVPMASVDENGKIDVSEIKRYSDVKKGFTNFQNGDVLFAKITPCMENGKGAIAQGLHNGNGFGSTEFHILRPDYSQTTSKWLYYLTSWGSFRKACEKNMTGSAGQRRVPKQYLEKYEVCIPPLSEQHHIAAVLDKVSDLIALRKRQLEKLDELVKARFVEMFGEPISNTKHLKTQKLGDICNLKAGDFTAAEDIQDVQSVKNPYPCYGGNGIRGYVDNYTQEGEFPIIGRQGALCGNVQYATGRFRNTEHAVLVSPKIAINKIWLFEMLKLEDLYRFHTGAAQPGLAVKTLNTIEIPMAKIEEQEAFASIYNKIFMSKVAVQRGLEKLETLKSALMQEYFG